MLVGERPLAQTFKSFERADPITLPFISPESRFDPGNLIGRLEKVRDDLGQTGFYSLSRKTVNTRENFWNVFSFATRQM